MPAAAPGKGGLFLGKTILGSSHPLPPPPLEIRRKGTFSPLGFRGHKFSQ